MTGFASLPEDLKMSIFSHLSYQAIGLCRLVCREWGRLGLKTIIQQEYSKYSHIVNEIISKVDLNGPDLPDYSQIPPVATIGDLASLEKIMLAHEKRLASTWREFLSSSQQQKPQLPKCFKESFSKRPMAVCAGGDPGAAFALLQL